MPPTIATDLEALLSQAENRLSFLISAGKSLDDTDMEWMKEIQRRVGTKDKGGDDLSLWKSVTNDSGLVTVIRDSLRTVRNASSYFPAISPVGEGVEVPIHNPEIASQLRTRYGQEEFERLFDLCERHGVFSIKSDKQSGLVCTSLHEGSENPDMSDRQWVTDTVRVGDLQKHKEPQSWPLALLTLARFYNQPEELKAFKRAIADPSSYRNGGPLEGVAHIFMPATLLRDRSWSNNKRLESHGLALTAFCKTFNEADLDALHTFTQKQLDSKENVQTLANAIVNLVLYFKAIDYPSAPSAGAWEETAFAEGLTSDTEMIRAGMSELKTLLYSTHKSKAPQCICSIIKSISDDPIFHRPEELDDLIERGAARIRERLLGLEHPMESPYRPWDSSLAFIGSSSLSLSDDVFEDAKMHFTVLKALEQPLLRSSGMIRYLPFDVVLKDGSRHKSPDGYLSKNYWIAFDNDDKLNLELWKVRHQFGSKDFSEPEVYLSRASLAKPNMEAQWFMVSEIARAYGERTLRMMRYVTASRHRCTAIERSLIEEGLSKLTEFTNRALARITGPVPPSRSNGLPCPTWSVPEAYEHVTSLVSEDALLPGVNTPLAWAKASLFDAAMKLKQAIHHIDCLF